MALNGDKGEINGIDCRMAHAKKYMFAYLLNCNINDNGKNVIRLYFVVDT